MHHSRGGIGRRSVMRATTAAAIAAIVAPTPLIIAQSAEATLRPIRLISSGGTLTIAVLMIMLAEKLDRAHGLDVQTSLAGGASSLMIDAVLSGSVELGNPGTVTAMQAIRRGADIKILAGISNNQLTAVIGNAMAKKSGLSASAPIADRVRALSGKTLGVNPVGSNYYQMTRALLKKYGLDPDNDVRLLPIADLNAMVTSLRQGRTDAIIGASGIVEQAVVLEAGSVWISGPRGDMPEAENVPVSVIVARGDTLDRRRADVDAFRAAMTVARDRIHRDPVGTGRSLKEQYFNKLSPEVWELAWNSVAPSYPANLGFSRTAWDYWISNDPKGAGTSADIDYKQAVYAAAQAS